MSSYLDKTYTDTTSWRFAIANAEHYLALGQKVVHIDANDVEDYPWDIVTDVAVSGLDHLFHGQTCWIYFSAAIEDSITMRWMAALSVRNHEQSFLGLEELTVLLGRLRGDAREQFQRIFQDLAQRAYARGSELSDELGKVMKDASALQKLALS